MRFTDLFIRRPILATVLNVFLLIAGWQAIRTLTVKDGTGHYYAGGGIVADSDPERELEETLWKAAALFDLAGASAQNWA